MTDPTAGLGGLDRSDGGAVALLRRLVSIPSPSGSEEPAARWLVEAMRALGLVRIRVDGAGNAVGEIGRREARRTVVLLGHIDTVPGQVPVRVVADRTRGELLYGRGTVDAKGPLATFVMAAARLGDGWARERDLRIVVVGAVEEEAATSRGARFVARCFDGHREPIPVACVIGEPSRWHRLTLGYKGRLLVRLEASRSSAHTAGPDPGIATAAVELWNRIDSHCREFNADRESPFSQLLPSLREVRTTSDGLTDTVRATCGFRLPRDYEPRRIVEDLVAWASAASGVEGTAAGDLQRGHLEEAGNEVWAFDGEASELRLVFDAYEPAWLAARDTPLVRSFVRAIREVGPEIGEPQRPGFVSKTGTSDMNVVGPIWGCPILAYGPGDSALDHTPFEHLPLPEYLTAIRVLERGLDHLAGELPS